MTTTAPERPIDTPPPPPPRPNRRRRWVAAAVVALSIWPLASYTQALTYPGNASFAVRTVEWVRDNGGGGLVDLVESIWYRQGPTATAPDPAGLPRPSATSSAAPAPAPLPVLQGATPVPGEGVWTAGQAAPGGTPAVYTTFIRPDPQHPSVVAGVARFDQGLTRTQVIAGTREPTGSAGPEGAQVPAVARSALVATFNSGFKMKDANGGYYADGQVRVPLRDGAASLVIHRDGTATIGRWGRDVTAGPDVVTVRQNLDLIVDGGRPVPGLDVNAFGTWGSARNQLQYTWRSGLGTDAAGNLIYVGGKDLTLASLADALTRAGAVTGMELDIHDNMVDLFTYRHDPSGALSTATKLLPNMPGPADRYLVPDQRDFVAITLR
ncbi:phosphodiester glycosidase family protein [Pseudonocardia hydrocarbonoxydans]|uniref:Phosphodiester glycosidase domain-containing protein n=1 Tax=Pseudonocardia hydrocarbonoxydans TaxID=76726 RepID=A0A4Y3WI27_9PSEU|nr:phosphodiester glycosidase family protein [Pseudonocardia hydrocarbonoxydans]GEC18612.1 hypothetical protein PHY01_08950 [Pseudonocardia hydrocarbonoxydans]